VIIVNFQVIRRFEASVDSSILFKREPQLNLITERTHSCLVGIDGGLNVDIAGCAFGVDLEDCKLLMNEVVSDERVWLSGEVGPGLYFE
jgi:hypothetical protein